ncbi:MAG TPA: Cj0069 family protein [Gaiellaceae bacterium]|nr:Cj0069 family protein [Gaiellaceae bacterium]
MRVGLLWRHEWDPLSPDPPRLHGVFAAFAELGVDAEAVVYSDGAVDAVREQLLELDGVLVWVNPIEQGLDRSRLDSLLREAADAGVFVSAHPDVILRMGTKEVLVDTQAMTWGTETRIYRSSHDLRRDFPGRLAEHRPLVLKQHRGMGGNGVWKVEPAEAGAVVVQHAAGGALPEAMTLADFLDRCEPYFAGAGLMVEQPYQPRLPEGMIRAYVSLDRVVGFAHQFPRGLLPPEVEPGPSEKVFERADAPKYSDLRARLDDEWVPEMQRILGLETHELPVIWDADFLFGDGDAFVLCEINVSSTFAFPEFAMPHVAETTLARIRERQPA